MDETSFVYRVLYDQTVAVVCERPPASMMCVDSEWSVTSFPSSARRCLSTMSYSQGGSVFSRTKHVFALDLRFSTEVNTTFYE